MIFRGPIRFDFLGGRQIPPIRKTLPPPAHWQGRDRIRAREGFRNARVCGAAEAEAEAAAALRLVARLVRRGLYRVATEMTTEVTRLWRPAHNIARGRARPKSPNTVPYVVPAVKPGPPPVIACTIKSPPAEYFRENNFVAAASLFGEG